MLKKIIVNLQNVDLNQPDSYAHIQGLTELFLLFKEQKIEINSLSISQKESGRGEDKATLYENCLRKEAGKKKDSLVISDLQMVIVICKKLGIPCIAYENKQMEKQDLFQANMLVEGFEEVNDTFVVEVYQRHYNEPIIIAKTKRLVIREMILADLDELYAFYEEKAVSEFLEPLYDREEEIAFTKAYIKNMYGFYGYGLWSLLDRKTGKLVGRAGLSNREVNGELQIELGYLIGAKYQRSGLAYEACTAILEFAIHKLECGKVNCFIHPKNKASVALVSKLGFAYMQDVEINNENLSWYRWTYEE